MAGRSNRNWFNGGPATSGGGSPGGPNTAVQFNDGGSFGGSANFTFDKVGNVVVINGTTPQLLIGQTSLAAAFEFGILASTQSVATQFKTTFANGYVLHEYVGPNNSLFVGVERSTGGGIFGNDANNAGVIGTTAGFPLQFAVNVIAVAEIDNVGNFVLIPGNFLSWSSTSLPDGVKDTSISRLGAASLAFGNGTNGDKTASLSFKNAIMGGKVTTYNGLGTVDNGVPSELANVDLTGQTAPITSTTLFAPTITGMYRISVYLKQTAVGTTPTLGPVHVIYTDGSDSTAQDNIMQLINRAGAGGTIIATNTTQSVLIGTTIVYAKSGTTINYSVGFSGTIGAATYEVHIKLEAM